MRPFLPHIISLIVLVGCSHLVIDEDDNAALVGGKVISRVVLCPITLCLSEMEIEIQARKKQWEYGARHPFTNASVREYPSVGVLMIITGDHAVAVSTVITTLQQMGARLVERSKVERLFEEQRFLLTYSRDREADYLKIGQMAGADQIVFVTVQSNPVAT